MGAIIIDCDDLDCGIAFWSGALGAGMGHWEGPYAFLDARPGGLGVGLQRVPEPKTAKSGVHLDVQSDDVLAEGARRRAQVESWWVMDDPCGTEFCVISGRREDAPAGPGTWGEGPTQAQPVEEP